MANAQPQIVVQLELIEREWRFLMNVLIVIVNGMERDGYATKDPERFRTATALLLQLQNNVAGRRVKSEPVPSPVTDTEGYEF